ncbi:MAG: hypothetical protein U5K54_13315 [Cytophagales bacterium]|nr:hypothetical protein [Cytophagales bacterium]
MALFDTLFGKKKKEFKASCQITKEPIEKGDGYLLTTAQVVSSKKYWDMVMTEPETLSYSQSHFKNQSSGTQMRSMIFEKFATIEKPWIISDTIINYFEVDKSKARALAKKWWETEGSFEPIDIGPAVQVLEESDYSKLKEYAILKAGREQIKFA